ncbi:hypothetical protein BDV30DRAFT_66048 [Aspergillus minisclerotigenes]|uniref:Uncharacterized protein n=1 Tax=Aspergillus minisclerotigenes TaxID=656917 RepID=A0A5N6IKH9_9EURO|nr:hypothetical protein BDV30DRAFT_66048 [Aspergillus minisclerotigenes]
MLRKPSPQNYPRQGLEQAAYMAIETTNKIVLVPLYGSYVNCLRRSLTHRRRRAFQSFPVGRPSAHVIRQTQHPLPTFMPSQLTTNSCSSNA